MNGPIAWMVTNDDGQDAYVTADPSLASKGQRALALYATVPAAQLRGNSMTTEALKQAREALQSAHACILLDRTALADCSANPDGTFDDDDLAGIEEYDATLGIVDEAVAALDAAIAQEAADREDAERWCLAVEKLGTLRAFLAGWRGTESCRRNGLESTVDEWDAGLAALGGLYIAARAKGKSRG